MSGAYDPLAGPTVQVPRALLRDVCTVLYHATHEDTLRETLERYAYPEPAQSAPEPQDGVS